MLRCIILSVMISGWSAPGVADVFNGGHVKFLSLLNRFPDDSLFADFTGSSSADYNGNARLKFDWQMDRVQLVTDYQLSAQYGDTIKLANSLPGSVLIKKPVTDDSNRLFDLTRTVSQDNDSALVHRLDRFYIDITTSNTVVRAGRQAVSWGNGLVYTPMDFINPFDPSAVDKEYKTGDDMLYGQQLMSDGDDLQMVWVIRRDSANNITGKVDSIAIKYHGFSTAREFDLLIARHYSDTIYALGGLVNVGEAVWRGDIILTSLATENVTSLVTSLSYSWVGWGHNISGVVEYFYNGFGQSNTDYNPAALASNLALSARLVRGELFTLARHYIAVSALIEVTPLWTLTPNVFININDNSYLAQLVSAYDFKQDWRLLMSLSVPVGGVGSEFGGVDSGVVAKPLSTELSLFAQLAWYF